MTYDPKINEARRNQIKILSILNHISKSYGFNEIKNKAKVHQNTLEKWLNQFIENKDIKKVGEGKRKMYEITDKGRGEFRKLTNEDNTEKTMTKMSLVDSMQIKKDVKVGNNIMSCQLTSSLSTILNDNKIKVIEDGFDDVSVSKIIKIFEPLFDESTSGSILINFTKK